MDKKAYQREIVQSNFIFYAPSIHTGGGLVLLKEILDIKDFINNCRYIYLDERIKSQLNLPDSIKNIIFIKSRLLAEWKLKKDCKTDDTILCFHGLPPLFPVKSKVIVFLQNRILLESLKNNNYSFRILLRKIWLCLGAKPNVRYIVQTLSMLNIAKEFLGKNINITILPFAPQNSTIKTKNSSVKKFDFIYPASGESHKNHLNLFKAWKILADENIKLSLAVTINTELYPELSKELQKYNLNIINLGEISLNEVLKLYPQTSAVIYPSKSESFGLPLIEATEYKIPIIASELDYVRDVANPVQTFDPSSPLSIARAVRRFLNNSEAVININSAEEFLKESVK
ncbi:MAG TPA: glycosyltransferase [Rickettsia endosymbiont of Pyrocoelia pectoralis]|nr:glycosyltransferase [Rickettsia endosymbiont of Pyrocoelia pectoralis]